MKRKGTRARLAASAAALVAEGLRDPTLECGDAGLVIWDIGPVRGDLGTPPPPITNTAPRIGVDPHDLVIESEARVRRQIAEFLRIDGRIIDVCGSAPCHAAGWTGP